MAEGQSRNWGQLMIAAQSGDSWAYACLLREILPDVRRIVRRHRLAPDRVEAVVQDVLCTLHRLRHTYDPARPFVDWVAAISRKRARAAEDRPNVAHRASRFVRRFARIGG